MTTRTEFEPMSMTAIGGRWTRRRGGDSLSDLPRPDKLGLVMKYLWALNGSSPAAAFMRTEVPSGKNFQLCSLSLKLAIMIWPRTCSCTVMIANFKDNE